MAFTHGKGLNLFVRKGRVSESSFSLSFLLFVFLLIFSPVSVAAQGDEGSGANLKNGKHLYKHYCAACHGSSGKGNGVNSDHLGDVHPTDLTGSSIDKLDDEEIYEVIAGGGAAVDISYYMPPWASVLSKEQIHSLIAYIRTLSEANGATVSIIVRFADVRNQGEACVVCHSKEKNLLRPIGPNIGHEGSKLRKDWLRGFLKQPEDLRPIGFMPLTKAKMPNFYFTDAEVDALVDYLMTLKDEGINPKALLGWNPTDPKEIEKGQIYFEDDYACDGCHKRSPDGDGGIIGPDLLNAVERIRPEWMFYWIKNPQLIRPDTPMPNFQIPDDRIRSILSYLYSLGSKVPLTSTVQDDSSVDPDRLAKGKKLVEVKNCQGCHLIDSSNSQLGSK